MARGFIAKPDLVSTTLIYPITLTCDSTSDWGFGIVTDENAPLGQNGFQVQTSAGALRWVMPTTGGPVAINYDVRVANAYGGAYAAYNGTATVPCIELPDGTGQGSKLWSGSGAPSSTTVGAAASGDYYLRGVSSAAPTLVASAFRSAAVLSAVGNGTLPDGVQTLAGTPVAGDLVVSIAGSTDATTGTATIGATSSIAAGGSGNDGTRYTKVFAKVIDSGDISSSQVGLALTNFATGTTRWHSAYVFRHVDGFTTATPTAVDTDSSTSGAAINLSVTGPTRPSVSAALAYGSANPTAPGHTYTWDSGSASNVESDNRGGSNTDRGSSGARPGRGTNTSGATGLTTGGSTVAIAGLTGSTAAILANWSVGIPTSTLYVCTSGGSPGTWTAVF
jgi:hypothetical protein